MRSKIFRLIININLLIIFTLFNIQCSDDISTVTVPEKKDWSYDGDTGPEYWGDLDPDYWLASYGRNQSPINIDTTTIIKSDLPNIQFHYEASQPEIENNGHAIEVIPHSGSYIEISGVRYDLLQYHFHSLSEHTVNGNYYPLECHFVHKNADDDFAVIGLFFKVGNENQNFKPITDHLPENAEEINELHSAIDPDDLLPADRRTYQYSGSLTTPPCSEGVKWFVLSDVIEMSRAQIDAFEAIYDHNYRPVQALNARQVLYDTTIDK